MVRLLVLVAGVASGCERGRPQAALHERLRRQGDETSRCEARHVGGGSFKVDAAKRSCQSHDTVVRPRMTTVYDVGGVRG